MVNEAENDTYGDTYYDKMTYTELYGFIGREYQQPATEWCKQKMYPYTQAIISSYVS